MSESAAGRTAREGGRNRGSRRARRGSNKRAGEGERSGGRLDKQLSAVIVAIGDTTVIIITGGSSTTDGRSDREWIVVCTGVAIVVTAGIIDMIVIRRGSRGE